MFKGKWQVLAMLKNCLWAQKNPKFIRNNVKCKAKAFDCNFKNNVWLSDAAPKRSKEEKESGRNVLKKGCVLRKEYRQASLNAPWFDKYTIISFI